MQKKLSPLYKTLVSRASLGSVTALAIVFGFTFLSFTSFIQDANALTAKEYCAKYSQSSDRYACQDGTKSGFDCNDYTITFGQKQANICKEAQKAVTNGTIDGKTSSGSNTASNCQGLNGDYLAVCQEGVKNKSCNENLAYIDINLFNSCAQGAGIPKRDKAPTSPSSESNPCQGLSGDLLSSCRNGQLNGKCNENLANVDLKLYNACAIGAGQKTLTSTPSPSESNNPFEELFKQLDQQGQAQNMTDFINALHEAGPNSDVDTSGMSDNNRGSYVNGAGQQQSIQQYNQCSTSNCPAIVLFAGGGWHSDDGVPDQIANEGSAKKRGYVLFKATYRLGSGGVYYQLEDTLRAIRHLVNNAGMYNIDPSKISLWGDSAGASLVTRAAATGKTGAKSAVNWSGPTNAYTGLFHSAEAFAIGLDHSTCVPTDLAGVSSTMNQITGGQFPAIPAGGIASNDLSNFGIGQEGAGPIPTSYDPNKMNNAAAVADILNVAQAVITTGQSAETISQQMGGGGGGGGSGGDGGGGMPGGVLAFSATKMIDCISNFNTMSPALFASPSTPPMFLAGFWKDPLVHPGQLYQMRDKLRALGIRSDALVLEGDENKQEGGCSQGTQDQNHLGYDCRFICPTLNFIDSVVQPETGGYDCETNKPRGKSGFN